MFLYLWNTINTTKGSLKTNFRLPFNHPIRAYPSTSNTTGK